MLVYVHMQDVSVGSHAGCQCRFTSRMSVSVHMQGVIIVHMQGVIIGSHV